MLTAVAWGKLPVHLHVKAVYLVPTVSAMEQFAKVNQAQVTDLPTFWRLCMKCHGQWLWLVTDVTMLGKEDVSDHLMPLAAEVLSLLLFSSFSCCHD